LHLHALCMRTKREQAARNCNADEDGKAYIAIPRLLLWRIVQGLVIRDTRLIRGFAMFVL
jgi:hypothetical protein